MRPDRPPRSVGVKGGHTDRYLWTASIVPALIDTTLLPTVFWYALWQPCVSSTVFTVLQLYWSFLNVDQKFETSW